MNIAGVALGMGAFFYMPCIFLDTHKYPHKYTYKKYFNGCYFMCVLIWFLIYKNELICVKIIYLIKFWLNIITRIHIITT